MRVYHVCVQQGWRGSTSCICQKCLPLQAQGHWLPHMRAVLKEFFSRGFYHMCTGAAASQCWQQGGLAMKLCLLLHAPLGLQPRIRPAVLHSRQC
jgi:hypothetical protein